METINLSLRLSCGIQIFWQLLFTLLFLYNNTGSPCIQCSSAVGTYRLNIIHKNPIIKKENSIANQRPTKQRWSISLKLYCNWHECQCDKTDVTSLHSRSRHHFTKSLIKTLLPSVKNDTCHLKSLSLFLSRA